jgi:hypothetical protein
MYYSPIVISLIEGVLVLVPALLGIAAYVTITERKTMANMRTRLGPNVVGYYGLLQVFADALKLSLKEYVAPIQANIIFFFCVSISCVLSLRSKLSKLKLPVIIFIKFSISTPPKPHAFVNLPLESKIGLNSFSKYLTKENIALSIIMFVVFYIFRYYILPDFFTLNITLDDFIFQISIPKELSAGFYRYE